MRKKSLTRFDFAGWRSRLQWAEESKALIYAAEGNVVTALMKQPLDGSPPEQIMDFDEDGLFDFGYPFNGQFLAIMRGARRGMFV